MLFLKTGVQEWTPVGEEELFSLVVGKEEKAAVVICDSDGNSKAMTSWLERRDAERITAELKAKGLGEYVGEVKIPL